MRIWDVHPGFLNRESLLGEHRELHGVVSIMLQAKRGYSNHPETKRWRQRGWALRQRHRLLAAEMAFRGYRDRTPVRLRSSPGEWPDTFIDNPGRQFALLAEKYRGKQPGRIALPRTSHELWSHHKYSVMARSQVAYRELGRRVSGLRGRDRFDELALELVSWLRRPPRPGDFRNVIEHMWGHLQSDPGQSGNDLGLTAFARMQNRVRSEDEAFLMAQTALTDLAAWP
ncbi:MAG: DUF1722 domain-containing protein [Gammaproteobacteria bacterium]|nr:DUF1722 domain-containing protein [Gammaproteobacteria bacterium]MXY56624.1 DUF1722 domain-containing protein [Gammaproteobacteria bacterium]MYK48186.1 DUF1722 domain-containing protein [Gammaproteobacteria bacterium]